LEGLVWVGDVLLSFPAPLGRGKKENNYSRALARLFSVAKAIKSYLLLTLP
jgi:hypothetical protein